MTTAVGFSPALPNTAATERMRAQATELEGVFLTTLVKEMFSSLGKEDVAGTDFGQETWRGMQAEQIADVMAKAGGIGLADSLMADLLALQESAPIASLPASAGAYR
jgi:flagellar protein FlgJ